jgi:hypothetical protein
MRTHEFRNTVAKHRCHRSVTLMQPYSQGRTTVTFNYDPTGAFAFVWLTATSTDDKPVHVDGGNYALERDWHISLFTDNARRVWSELLSKGWVEIARGSIGEPVSTK